MPRVTLLDVARHCGVSRATVSLVLNESPLVAAHTRDRVRRAMPELGYVYNRAAASLRTRHGDAIGVVLTNITNPYFAEFAAGLQDTLTSSGTVPLLAVSGEDRELQHRLVQSLVERNVDGIVLVPAHGTAPADLPDLLGTPVVLLARHRNGMDVDVDGDTITISWTPNNLAPHHELVKRVSRSVRRAGYPVVLTERMGIATNSHMCGTAVAGADPTSSVLDPNCRSHDITNCTSSIAASSRRPPL